MFEYLLAEIGRCRNSPTITIAFSIENLHHADFEKRSDTVVELEWRWNHLTTLCPSDPPSERSCKLKS